MNKLQSGDPIPREATGETSVTDGREIGAEGLGQKIKNLSQRVGDLLTRIESIKVPPNRDLYEIDATETSGFPEKATIFEPEDKVSKRAKKAVKRAIKVNMNGPKRLTVSKVWHMLLELFDRVFANRETGLAYQVRDAIAAGNTDALWQLLCKKENIPMRDELRQHIEEDNALLGAIQGDQFDTLRAALGIPKQETAAELQAAAAPASVEPAPASNPSAQPPARPSEPFSPAAAPARPPVSLASNPSAVPQPSPPARKPAPPAAPPPSNPQALAAAPKSAAPRSPAAAPSEPFDVAQEVGRLVTLNGSRDKTNLISALCDLTDDQLIAVLSKMRSGFLGCFNNNGIRKVIKDRSANYRAAVLTHINPDRILSLLRDNSGGKELALAEDILAGIDLDQLVPILARIPTYQRLEVVQNLPQSIRVRLAGISTGQRRTLLEGLASDQRRIIEALLTPAPARPPAAAPSEPFNVDQEVTRLVRLNRSTGKTDLISALRDLTDEQLIAVLSRMGSRFLGCFNNNGIRKVIEGKSANYRAAVLTYMDPNEILSLLRDNSGGKEWAPAEGILAGIDLDQLVPILARIPYPQRLETVQHLPQSIRKTLAGTSTGQRRTLLEGLASDRRSQMEALLTPAPARPPAPAPSVVQQPPPPARRPAPPAALAAPSEPFDVAQEVGRLVTLNGSRDKTNLIPALRDLTDEQLMAVLEKTGSRFLISFNDDEIYEIIEDKSADCRVAVLMHMNQSYIPLLLWANPDNDEERALAEGILAGMNANQLVPILARIPTYQRLEVVQNLPQSIREMLAGISLEQRRTLLGGLDGDQQSQMKALLSPPAAAPAASKSAAPRPPARPPAPATAAQRASETLRSSKPLLRLPEILNGSNRRDQNMCGDGLCGFYAILSQIDQRFGGNALATQRGVQSQKVRKAVGDLQVALGYTRGSTAVGNWLDSQRLQQVAQHTKKAVVLIDTMGSRRGDDVKQIDLAIPVSDTEAVVLTVASPDVLKEKFSEWARNLLRENYKTTYPLLRKVLTGVAAADTCTVREAIEGLLRKPQTIGLLHPTPNHFHALQPAPQPPAPAQASARPAAAPNPQFDVAQEVENLEGLNRSEDKTDLIARLHALPDEQLMAVLSETGSRFLTRFNANEIFQIIENKSANFRAAVLMNMDPGLILQLLLLNSDILTGIDLDQLVPILARIPTYQRLEVVQNLPQSIREMLAGISLEQRRTLLQGLNGEWRREMEALLPQLRTGWRRLIPWR